MKHASFVRKNFLGSAQKIFAWEKSRLILKHPVEETPIFPKTPARPTQSPLFEVDFLIE
jgi:hypothetical protein